MYSKGEALLTCSLVVFKSRNTQCHTLCQKYIMYNPGSQWNTDTLSKTDTMHVTWSVGCPPERFLCIITPCTVPCVKLSSIAKFLLCVSPLAEVFPETDRLFHLPFGHWAGGCCYHCVGPLESIQCYIMTLIWWQCCTFLSNTQMFTCTDLYNFNNIIPSKYYIY